MRFRIKVTIITSNSTKLIFNKTRRSVYEGHNAIKAGEAKIIVSGGMENMTMAKHIVSGRVGTKLGNLTLEDTILADGLTDPMIKLHMGDTGNQF